ncbi:hypothetical protein STRIP9103_09728, partial [Streptomyces ipomoeae 91-03]
MSAAAE